MLTLCTLQIYILLLLLLLLFFKFFKIIIIIIIIGSGGSSSSSSSSISNCPGVIASDRISLHFSYETLAHINNCWCQKLLR